MRMNLFPTFTRAADGADGGGAAGSAPPAAAAPPSPGSSAQPAAAGATPPPGPAAGQAQQQPAAGAADYWPEGLDARYRGSDAKTTLDNLAGALKGYRDRDARNLVPDTPDGYAKVDQLKDFKIEDRNKPYFDMLGSDPAFKAMAQSAHKYGVGQLAVAEIYQSGLNAMAEAGLLEPLVDPKAERAQLVPEAARSLPEAEQAQAVEKRMQENADWLKLMSTTKGLDPEVAKYAELMMFDSAKGHKFFEWARSMAQGEGGKGPAVINAGQGNTREALRAELAKLNPNAPDYAKKHAELQARYQQVVG